MFNRKRKKNKYYKIFPRIILIFSLVFEILKNIEWKINIKEEISYYRIINFNF